MGWTIVDIALSSDSRIGPDRVAAASRQCVVHIDGPCGVRLCSLNGSEPMRRLAAVILEAADHYDAVNAGVVA